MLQRELTYQLSFKRLAKLSRSAGRKAFRTVWLLTWLWVLLLLLAVVFIVIHADTLRDPIKPFGVTPGQGLVFVAITIFFAGRWWLRKIRIAQLKHRGATFDETIRLTQDEGGLRFSTDQVETYLKWNGISQVILERDGVVVSHGNFFFLVPDAVFADAAERLDFIRDVYARLGEKAQAISLNHIRPRSKKPSNRTAKVRT